MKTATFVKDITEGWKSDAKLYRLSHRRKVDGKWFNHVVVSASSFYVRETYIFAANEDGTCLNWGELNGSFQGDLDHEQALKNAGYTIK